MVRPPIFLERRSYRKRRLMDVVRLLPLLVLGFWMVPLMWPVPGTGVEAGVPADEIMPMSTALGYVFGVWASMVLAGWVLWRVTRMPEADAPEQPD